MTTELVVIYDYSKIVTFTAHDMTLNCLIGLQHEHEHDDEHDDDRQRSNACSIVCVSNTCSIVVVTELGRLVEARCNRAEPRVEPGAGQDAQYRAASHGRSATKGAHRQ